MTQKEIVYAIVKKNEPIRTEQIKIIAMQKGVSCPDRYLRWLQADGIVESERLEGDKTHTWRIKQIQVRTAHLFGIKPLSPFAFNSQISTKSIPEKQLSMSFIKDNRQELDRILA